MVESVLFAVLTGCILGYLAGLGVGGGTLLILWLTAVLNKDPQTARLINLMFFVTAAGSVSLIRLRQKTIPWKKILPAIVAGSIGAFLFSYIGRTLHTDLIRSLFGALLLITGIRELLYRPRKDK